jgi:hypothetical protein
MVELREIRANRLGFTFKRTLRRDPFRFVSDGFLLMILYGITRPKPSAAKVVWATGSASSAAARSAGTVSGSPWGNDDPEAPVQPKRPSAAGNSGLIWPTKRYQDPSPWELLQRYRR